MIYVEEHHLKSVAKGLPIVLGPIVIYSDDMSGNLTKRWNKFDCYSMSFAGLPVEHA